MKSGCFPPGKGTVGSLGDSKSLIEGTGGYFPNQIPASHGKKRRTNGSAEIRTRGSLGLEVPVFSGGFLYRYPSLCRVAAFTASGTSEVMAVEPAAAAASLLGAPVVAEANDGLFRG